MMRVAGHRPQGALVLCAMLGAIVVFAQMACHQRTEPTAADAKRQRIKIVSSLVRTGSANAQTSHIVGGIRLALEQSQYQIGPYQIVYEDWDDASARKGDWDPEVEAANAHTAVRDRDVVAYIGPYNSGAAKISLPILNRAGLATVSPIVSYPGLTKPELGENNEPRVYQPSGRISFFRVVPTDDLQGFLGAQWMRQMGGQSVYILDDLQLYGKGVADVFDSAASKLGLQVLAHESIDPKAQEYRSLMAKIKQHQPDWIYFGGTTQTNAGQLIKDMVAMGLTCKMMLPDGCFEESLIDAAGAENANGRVFLTLGGVLPEQLQGSGADFVQQYQKRFKTQPDVYGVYGYVAAQTVLDAIKRAHSKDREAIRQAIAQTQQHQGALGTWRFDAYGDTTMQTMSGNVVEDGRFQFLTLLDPQSPSPTTP